MQVGDRHVARREAALTPLILKRGSASRERRDDDYDVLENGGVVGRIVLIVNGCGHGDIRRAAHGYEATREVALVAFAKSWRRQ